MLHYRVSGPKFQSGPDFEYESASGSECQSKSEPEPVFKSESESKSKVAPNLSSGLSPY